jgi:hypothetical protein
MPDFNVEDFSEEVFRGFEFLKVTGNHESFFKDLKKNSGKGLLSGCLFIPFITAVDKFGRKTTEAIRRKEKYFENERNAESLLARGDIKKAVCDALKGLSKKEILTEEKFVKTITSALVEKNSEGEFTIPVEPFLFAMIAFKIWKIGSENFCRNLSDEE